MSTGHVKVFHAGRNHGFIVASDGNEYYVSGDAVPTGALRSGDEVEFEIAEGDRGRPAAVSVKVTRQAPEGSPVGRTLAPPPTWEALEERERQRRMARRRRR